MAFVYLDISDAPTAGVLRALMRYLDKQLGYPKPSTNNDGTAADAAFATTHHTRPIPHPQASGRWMLPLDPAAVTKLSAVRAAARAQVTAGTAGPLATIIAAVPNPVALDGTWSANVIRSWDPGPELLPSDDFPGQAADGSPAT